MKRIALFSIFVATVVCCPLTRAMDDEGRLVRCVSGSQGNRDRHTHLRELERWSQEEDDFPSRLGPDGWGCCCLGAVLGCALVVCDVIDKATFRFRDNGC